MTDSNEDIDYIDGDDEDEDEGCCCDGEGICNDCRFASVGGSCGDRFLPFIEKIQQAGFSYLGSGGFRKVYRRKEMVIKVPRVNDGILDNRVEAAGWRKYKSKPTDQGIFLAPCRLLPNGCLMMVSLTMDVWGDPPPWAYKIDSNQVGRYKGRVVAYDFALDLTERAHWEDEWNHFSVFFQSDWLERKPHLRKRSAA